MAKNTLTEIHKNKVGTGLLIENDGYISMKDGDNRLLYESIQKINEEKGDEFYLIGKDGRKVTYVIYDKC